MKQLHLFFAGICLLAFLATPLNAQSAADQPVPSSTISLLDVDKVAAHLLLDSLQLSTVTTIINDIRAVIQEDEQKITEMRARFRSGDTPGLFEKLKLRGQRNDRIDRIESLVDKIKDELTPEQRERFDDFEVPQLPKLSPDSFKSDAR